jgi:hypothetical protein
MPMSTATQSGVTVANVQTTSRWILMISDHWRTPHAVGQEAWHQERLPHAFPTEWFLVQAEGIQQLIALSQGHHMEASSVLWTVELF